MLRVETLFYLLAFLITVGIAAYIFVRIYTQPKMIQPAVDEVSMINGVIRLPLPKKVTNVTVEEAILWRRSIREYTSDPLTIEQLSMILWAAYGVTDPIRGFRASPSAGATYPLELYVVIGRRGVVDRGTYLREGVYKYDVYTHTLRLIKEGDFREELCRAALGQEWVREAPVNIVITAVFERTTRYYGERGERRYVPMEVGHVGQNIYLMATALRLGTVAIGAFYDDWVSRIISAPPEEVPLYIMPVGVPKAMRMTSFEEIQSYISSRRG